MPEDRGDIMTREHLPTEGATRHELNDVDRALSQAREKLQGREPIGGGAGWLYNDEAEVDALKSEDLKRVVRHLERTNATATGDLARQALERAYAKIDDWVMDGKVDSDEAQDFLIKINERAAELAAASAPAAAPRTPEAAPAATPATPETPLTPDELRKKNLDMLDRIEQRVYPVDTGPNSEDFRKLQEMLRDASPEVQREARARINLHECYIQVRGFSGKPENVSDQARAAATKLSREVHLIDREDLHLLLREGLRDQNVREALEMMQDYYMNTEFDSTTGKLLKTSVGGVELNFRGKGWEEGEIERLVRGRYSAVSFRLAYRLSHVLAERSVWNKTLSGNDPLGEMIHLAYYRSKRAKEARSDSGPEMTRGDLDCLATSFLRHAILYEKEEENLARSRKAYIDGGRKLSDRENLVKRVIDIRREKKLDFGALDYRALTEGAYSGWLSSTLPDFMKVKELILKEAWKPDEVNVDILKSWIKAFEKSADPYEIMSLKTYFVLGVFDEGIRMGPINGWGVHETMDLYAIFTAALERDEKGNPKSFLTKEQMDWVMREANAKVRSAKNEFSIALRGAQRVRGGRR